MRCAAEADLEVRGAEPAAHTRRSGRVFRVGRLHGTPITARVRLAAHAVAKSFRGGCRANAVWPISIACRDAGRRSGRRLPVPSLRGGGGLPPPLHPAMSFRAVDAIFSRKNVVWSSNAGAVTW